MSKIEQVKIKDISNILTDYVSNGSFKSLADNVTYLNEGYARLIRLLDYNNNFDERSSVWINEHAYNFLSKSKLFGEEIIISNVGEYAGTAFLAPKLGYPTSLAPNSIMLTTNQNDLFYYYYFKSPQGYKNLRSIVSSSGQPKFNKTNFKELVVPKPSICIQNKIVSTLHPIDKLINNNIKTIQTLESLAKTIYDYWFLQFEFPNEEEKPYKSSGGKMVWNVELDREIPEGWEVNNFGDIFNFIKGKIPNSPLTNETTKTNYAPYITIDVTNGGRAQFCNPDNMVNLDGETVMVMDGAASGDVYVGNVGILGSTFSKLILNRKDISNRFLYEILNSNKVIYKRANTGSTVPHANSNFIKAMKLPLPENCKSYSKTFDLIGNKITNLKQQNQQLASLRDWLLPMLMNGQVTFKNKDEQ